ncbi:MAG TPA: EFR1 family ferrodoxin [Lachnospiraceae bacterium]|nr:EFR1 family ferrodoxin [Lachnospiraceae bacterium]
MPDNYVLLYNLPTKEKAMEILKNSELLINELIPKLKMETRQSVSVSFRSKLYTKSLYFLYRRGRKTKRFYADSNCVSCGLCARICPQKAIKMDQGKPQWTKKQCVQCLACIHRCPSAAIQYGKGTRKRNRYVNPILGKEL